MMNIDIMSYMKEYNADKSEKINLRSFKIAINDLKCLTLYNIDNLAKYMDTENEGFISTNRFFASVNNSNTMGSSFKNSHTLSHKKSPERKTEQSFASTKRSDTMGR